MKERHLLARNVALEKEWIAFQVIAKEKVEGYAFQASDREEKEYALSYELSLKVKGGKLSGLMWTEMEFDLNEAWVFGVKMERPTAVEKHVLLRELSIIRIHFRPCPILGEVAMSNC